MSVQLLPPAAAAARTLGLRRRADVTVSAIWLRGRRFWNLKDPVALRYYQLRDEEFMLWEMLDGTATLEQLQQRFERQFAPQKILLGELQSFLGMLHEQALVITAATGQAAELLARRDKTRRREGLATLTNPLAIRFRGWAPGRFLDFADAWAGWLFDRPAVTIGLLAILATVVFAAARCQTVIARIPDFHAFFSLRDAGWFVAILAVVKLLHELGHALSCRRFGSECPEIGVMLLCFVPCLYCNVSDAWMLRSRWQRAAVSAAGMYVELLLAAGSFWLWWYTGPGLLNALALKLAFVASAGTVLFNGNPLLRYDGYFILSDLVETPNLQQQGLSVVQRALCRAVLGIDLGNERTLPERNQAWFALYVLLAAVYRWTLLAGMLWIFYAALKPYRAEVLVMLLGTLMVGMMLVMPAVQAVRFVRQPQRAQQIKRRRAAVWFLTFAAALLGLATIKWPYHVSASATIEPADARRVYVTAGGTLTMAVAPGTRVVAGQTLGRLENRELQFEVVKLAAERDSQRLHLANLEHRQFGDRSTEIQIPAARATLAELEDRLQQRQRDLARLVLIAPTAGIVLPPPARPKRDVPDELNSWTGTPLEPENLGAFLETGVTFCLVGDPNRNAATVVLDQADLEFVRVDQTVELRLDAFPDTAVTGQIVEIAATDLRAVSREQAARRDLPTTGDDAGIARPTSAVYQARVALDSGAADLLPGAAGRARIAARPQSLAARIWRFVSAAFVFRH